MTVRHIDYRSSAYNLAAAGEEMRDEKWTKKKVEEHCKAQGLDKEQTKSVLAGFKTLREDRVDALVKDCDKLAARMDALNKRADTFFSPKRADAGYSKEEQARNQREAFGFATGSPGQKNTATFERRKAGPEMVPTGSGKSVERSKVNKVTKSLLGWK